MKKQIANRLKKTMLTLGAVVLSTIALGGCSTLSYVGEDFDAKNSALIQTDEMFYFSTYNKTSASEDISMRVGISKTPVPDVLAAYVQINNNSSANDYVFYTKDFELSANNTPISLISSSNYLGAYQSSQAGALASMSQASGTLSNIANIANNYQRLNQTNPIAETTSVSSSDGAYKQISTVVEGISEHTINTAAVVKPKENKFFYLFIKDPGVYPINVTYKDLSYSFMVKGNGVQEDDD